MVKTWCSGDGYSEPREEDYVCPNCGNTCYYNQSMGEEWEYEEEEEE